MHGAYPYVHAYKQAVAFNMCNPHDGMRCILLADPETYLSYNRPTASEVPAIISNDCGQCLYNRDIVLYKNDSDHPDGHRVVQVNELPAATIHCVMSYSFPRGEIVGQ